MKTFVQMPVDTGESGEQYPDRIVRENKLIGRFAIQDASADFYFCYAARRTPVFVSTQQ
jgi:hypothetical protein